MGPQLVSFARPVISGGVTGDAGKAAELLGPQLLGPQMGCWGTNITACAETLGGGGWAFELDPLCGTSDLTGNKLPVPGAEVSVPGTNA